MNQWIQEQNPASPWLPGVKKRRDALESRLRAAPTLRTF